METIPAPAPPAIRTYRERREHSAMARLRRAARDLAIFGMSLGRAIPATSNWIRFPYYHHVFDDERRGFHAHLRYLKNFGDFISMDAAAEHLGAASPPSGRYFCLTFDDGFKNHFTNAAPILVELRAVAAFFVISQAVGATLDRDAEALAGLWKRLVIPPIEVMSWDDCRRLVAAGMTIGSHTASHRRLRDLPVDEVERELKDSKATIEARLGTPCHHFCCPFGMPLADFLPDREPHIASRLGYRTFLTTQRGSHRDRPSPLSVERDHVVAAWPTYQLRYFFSR
jgi:peptidoglycan/xylan/chitin deacetylase (PgdA/CDA1 family)